MSERIHILVVEDDLAIQVLIERTVNVLLKAFQGSMITPVPNWTDALVVLSRDDPPDVAVIDLGLPDSVIEDTISRLKEVEAVCPVVVVTGCADAETIKIIESMGIEVIMKSPDFTLRIVRAIGRLLISRKTKHAEKALGEQADSIRSNIARIKEIISLLPDSPPAKNVHGE